MSKIIIYNQSDLTDIQAMELVQSVTKSGRISNNGKQYCYLSVFLIDGFDYHVVSDLNERSDKFVIYKSNS